MKKLPYYFSKNFVKGYIYTLQRRWDIQFSIVFMFVEGEIWGSTTIMGFEFLNYKCLTIQRQNNVNIPLLGST